MLNTGTRVHLKCETLFQWEDQGRKDDSSASTACKQTECKRFLSVSEVGKSVTTFVTPPSGRPRFVHDQPQTEHVKLTYVQVCKDAIGLRGESPNSYDGGSGNQFVQFAVSDGGICSTLSCGHMPPPASAPMSQAALIAAVVQLAAATACTVAVLKVQTQAVFDEGSAGAAR